MAPQWLGCGTAVLLLLVHVAPVITQTCGAKPGVPGIPGTHGPDGRDGPPGDKGDPGESSHSVKGQKGQQGMRGPPGRPGMKGDVGQPGDRGPSGQPGKKGKPFIDSSMQRTFFSQKLVTSQSPELNTDIAFSSAILPELDSHLQGESLINGTFTCTIKGIYFFSYHISAKSRVCLNLMKGSQVHMTLCDFADGFLVSSGSALLELEVGDTVSLQATRHNNFVTQQTSSSHTFTGFLIFSTA